MYCIVSNTVVLYCIKYSCIVSNTVVLIVPNTVILYCIKYGCIVSNTVVLYCVKYGCIGSNTVVLYQKWLYCILSIQWLYHLRLYHLPFKALPLPFDSCLQQFCLSLRRRW